MVKKNTLLEFCSDVSYYTGETLKWLVLAPIGIFVVAPIAILSFLLAAPVWIPIAIWLLIKRVREEYVEEMVRQEWRCPVCNFAGTLMQVTGMTDRCLDCGKLIMPDFLGETLISAPDWFRQGIGDPFGEDIYIDFPNVEEGDK